MELPTDASSPGPLPPPPSPPPPPPSRPAAAERHRPRLPAPGELTTTWRVVTALVWAGVFVAFIAVWKTSVELGMTTWWLGPLGDPRPAPIRMLPYVPPTLMVMITLSSSRFVPYAGLAASAVLAAIGAADLSTTQGSAVPRIAVVELAIALAGLLVSIAGFSGRYRPAPDTDPDR